MNFVVAEGSLDALLSALSDGGSTRVDREPCRTETFYDSFDWRLYRKNTQLVCRRRRRAVVASLITPQGRLEAELNFAPVFARDLPPSPLFDALGPILSVRRLMPVARARRRPRTVHVLNEDGKTVARIQADRLEVAPPERRVKWTTVKPSWVLRPLRGYDAEAEAIGERLARLPDVRRDSRSELDRLLGEIGREAGGYSSGFRVALERQLPAGAAVRRVLATLFETMRVNEAGTIADLDPEFLHDFRVAVRRTRSCIGQMRATLPEDRLKPFREDFAWLGSITGPTRDLDVFVLDLLDRRTELAAVWEPLVRLVQRDQRREQRKMAARLRTERYRGLLARWSAFLAADPVVGEAAESDRPIVEAAAERIARKYARMLTRGAKLDAWRATDALHRLRIEGKKLRYLLEFFRGVFPAETVGPPIAALKRLQDNLGELNDLRVQQAALPQLARRLETDGRASADTFVFIGRLLERLAGRERLVRREFSGNFKLFASDDIARLIR